MKILKLDLLAFGPFRGQSLDLNDGGLHLIYGPNEAGKSSTLRALRNLLFGIPANTTDNFIHPHTSLRIGATLKGKSGQLDVIRRKGTKNTLLKRDGKTPHDDEILSKLLGGATQNVFDSMFGIDHEELVRGGRSITQGSGDLAQILFAAGTGLPQLDTVQKALDSEAEARFKPGGKIPRINTLIAQVEALRKEIKESLLPSSQWVEHNKALQEAKRLLSSAESEIALLRREKNRLERIRDALPLIVRRSTAKAALAELGKVVLLPDGFSERRRELLTKLNVATAAEKRSREMLAEAEREYASLDVPEALLSVIDRVEHLRESLGSYRKAQHDLPALKAKREQILADATTLLRAMRPDLTLNEAEQLRITKREISEINRLGNHFEALVAEDERARTELAELKHERADVQQRLAGMPAAKSSLRLQDIIQRWQNLGDLDQQLQSARDELHAAETQAVVELRKLPLWSGSLEELEMLAVPAAESIERFEQDSRDASEDVSRAKNRIEELSSRHDQRRQQIDQLQREGSVVTEEDLIDARQIRDQAWLQLLDGSSAEESNHGQGLLFTIDSKLPADGNAIRRYEESVRHADSVADRLRREAARVAQMAQLAADVQSCELQLERARQDLVDAQQRSQQIQAAWLALWQPLGLVPASPREMRAWDQKQKQLCARAQAIRMSRSVRARLEDQIAAARAELLNAVREVLDRDDDLSTLPGLIQGQALAPALLDCRRIVREIDDAARRRQHAIERLEELDRKERIASREVEEAAQKLKSWRTAWQTALTRLGAPAEISPDQASELIVQVADLFAKLDEAENIAERIIGIGHESQAFRADVAQLLARVAPDLQEQPFEGAIEELISRLRKAELNNNRRTSLRAQLKKLRDQLEQAEVHVTQHGAQLAAMCTEAGCTNATELPEVERVSTEAQRLQGLLSSLEEQLEQLSGGTNLEEFARRASETSADELVPKIADFEDRLRTLDAQRAELNQTLGSESAALKLMDGNAHAADRSEQLQQLLAQIESEVEQYARFRIASAVLREAVARYRQRSEGPVLKRAGQFFHQLTLGSFETLRADYNDKGDAVLVGVRNAGKELVEAHELSEGTADQLYLSIRLAALEEYLASATEPLPLVVDDILVNFDDARAVAALKILAEIAQKTQVLFFTHHRHLMDLASAHLSTGVLNCHQLPGRNLLPADN